LKNVVIRGLEDGVHAALVKRAREHGRSLEAQLRVICGAAALPEGRVRMGAALAAVGRRFGGVELPMLARRRHDSA
jgi:plasmid stability protein